MIYIANETNKNAPEFSNKDYEQLSYPVRK